MITEVAYLVETRLGSNAEIRFPGDLSSGKLIAEPVVASDRPRIAALVSRHRDVPVGTVDRSVVAVAVAVAVAGRHHPSQVATLDRRHLTIVRPEHVDPFGLLP